MRTRKVLAVVAITVFVASFLLFVPLVKTNYTQNYECGTGSICVALPQNLACTRYASVAYWTFGVGESLNPTCTPEGL